MTVRPFSSSLRASAISLIVAAAAAAWLLAAGASGVLGWLSAYLCAWLFVLGLSLGSMALIIVHNLTGGGWGWSIRPFLEAAQRMFPINLLLALPLLVRITTVLPWIGDARPPATIDPGQLWYLNPRFFSVRALLYFAVWLTLARILRTDPARATRPAPGTAALGFVLFALTTTFAAIDWMMALAPEWRSTGFGLLIGVGQVLSALSGAIVWAAVSGSRSDPRRSAHFHDLGKLLLALVLLWAYLAFMQFLIIWIEDLPSEIGWYLVRTHTSWSELAFFIAGAHFIVPFLLLLSRRAKTAPPVLAAIALLVLCACLADTYWVVVPATRPLGLSLHGIDLVAMLAVGGLWFGLLARAIGHVAGAWPAQPSSPSRGEHAAQHA